MVGKGVLHECLQDPGVQSVQIVGRTPGSLQHAKLRELLGQDLSNFASVVASLSGLDACFFCPRVSAAKVSAAEYESVTYGITLAAAETLARLSPQMTWPTALRPAQ
jgi:hypothetical protein